MTYSWHSIKAVAIPLAALLIISCGGSGKVKTDIDKNLSTGPLLIKGQVIFDDGIGVDGVEVIGNIVTEKEITVAKNVKLRSLASSKNEKAFIEPSKSVSTVTTADGNFSFSIDRPAEPHRYLIKINYHASGLPIMQSAKWLNISSSAELYAGVIQIPNPSVLKLKMNGTTAESLDGSIRYSNLPLNIKGIYGRLYDPDEDPDAMPGEFTEMGMASLNSTLFVWNEALDADGNPVKEFEKEVEVMARVPESQWRDLKDIEKSTGRIEIPIYTFDENMEMWVADGTGWLVDRVGNIVNEDEQKKILDKTFRGELFAKYLTKHFSWFNVDYPFIGPWQMDSVPIDKRNNKCFFDSVVLANKILKSSKGQQAFSYVNKPDGNILEEFKDGQGPGIEVFEPGYLIGWLGGDPQGYYNSLISQDNVFMNTDLWNGCNNDSNDLQKKFTTLKMAMVLLHETAHWKDDILKHANSLFTSDGEEGWIVQRRLFGGDLGVVDGDRIVIAYSPEEMETDETGSIQYYPLSIDELDDLLSSDYWEAVPADDPPLVLRNVGSFKSSAALASSPIELILSPTKEVYDLLDGVPVNLEIKNISSEPVSVFNKPLLEGWPISFIITNNETGEMVPYVGPQPTVGLSADQFTSVASGETISFGFGLYMQPEAGWKNYAMDEKGMYSVKAVYEPYLGFPRTESNTVIVNIDPKIYAWISGRVIDDETNLPVSNARVRIQRSQGGPVFYVTSDAEGYYSTGLPIGAPPAGVADTSTLGFRDYFVFPFTNDDYSVVKHELVTIDQNEKVEQNLILKKFEQSSDSAIIIKTIHDWVDRESGDNRYGNGTFISYLIAPYEEQSCSFPSAYRTSGAYAFFEYKLDRCPNGIGSWMTRKGDSWAWIYEIDKARLRAGEYKFGVYGEKKEDFDTYNLKIEVSNGDEEAIIHNPPDVINGVLWRVLKVDGATGVITLINETIGADHTQPTLPTSCRELCTSR